MPYPVDYLTPLVDDYERDHMPDSAQKAREALVALEPFGLVATRVCPPFGGQIARVRIEVFGESAAECEMTLLEYAGRCDAASQAGECSYGQCVIERNLAEEWGATYSWKGRITLHPNIGTIATAQRAAATIED